MSVTTTRGVPRRRKTVVAARASVGRDDRAQGERRGPAQARDRRLGHDRDDRHREQHEPHREAGDRREVRAKVAQRRPDGGCEEQWRQEDEQHEVRLEGEPRQSRDEGQAESAQHDQCRVGHADALGDLVQDRDDDENDEDGCQDVHVWCFMTGLSSPRDTLH